MRRTRMGCRLGPAVAVIVAGPAVAVALALPGSAQAAVTALATRSGGQAPVLGDGRVLWSTRAGPSGIRVFSRAAGGGPVQVVGRATLPAADGRVTSWRFVAAPGWVGLRARGRRATGERLFAGALGSALQPLRSGVPAGALIVKDRDTWAWPPGGFVTLERRPNPSGTETARNVVLTDASGGHHRLALPAGADPTTLALAGGRAAVVIGDSASGLREVDVLDPASGAVQRKVRPGALSALDLVTSLSLSPEGELAITGEDGAGNDGLGWASATATKLDLVMVADGFGLVQVAHGSIAMVSRYGPDPILGERVLVLEPRPGGRNPRVRFRGPPANQVEALDFDGTHVAWATQDACQLVADATPADSNLVMPRGPCIRTQVAAGSYSPPRLRGAAVGIRMTCLTAPAARCRLIVRAFDGRTGHEIGERNATVARNSRRLLYIPVSRRSADRIRRGELDPSFVYTVVDPDGRRRADTL